MRGKYASDDQLSGRSVGLRDGLKFVLISAALAWLFPGWGGRVGC